MYLHSRGTHVLHPNAPDPSRFPRRTARVQWGFRATWPSSDADPPAFWLNGAACAIG